MGRMLPVLASRDGDMCTFITRFEQNVPFITRFEQNVPV